MAISTLLITRTDLKRYLGRFLQASQTAADWSGTTIETDVDDFIESGERNFYHHSMILPGETSIHTWSFLNITPKLGIVSGQWEYDLPEDFGGFVESYLSFGNDEDASHQIQLVGPDEIYRYRSLSQVASESYPQLAAVNNIPSDLDRPPRQSLMLWPTPSTARLIVTPYVYNPGGITDTVPYHLGGQPHSETLLASCLASAELLNNDEQGVHKAQFMEKLAASILLDRKLSTPKSFGYNGDPSCPGYKRPPLRRHLGNEVTYSVS